MSRRIDGSSRTISTNSGLWDDPCSTGGRSEAQEAIATAAAAAITGRKDFLTLHMTASIRKTASNRTGAGRALALAALVWLALGAGRGRGQDLTAATAADNVVLQWNNACLEAIRRLPPGPTVAARSLAVLHTAMFDAWSAYDAAAVPTIQRRAWRRPLAERTEANKAQAVSFAAYR